MSINVIDPLKGREYLRRCMCNNYLEGECYELAIAIHRGTNLPLFGLRNKDGVIWHAVVKVREGYYIDARGVVAEGKLHVPFGNRSSFSLEPIHEKSLTDTRPVPEILISSAQRKAEVAWPELPWVTSNTARAVAFAEALEHLCREHGFWIRSPYPTAAPRLEPGDGDEAGYTISITADGVGLMIDRRY